MKKTIPKLRLELILMLLLNFEFIMNIYMIDIVFLVAGMSSRFNGNPKQMAKIGPNNETLIEISVNQALTQNFNSIYFITNINTQSLF